MADTQTPAVHYLSDYKPYPFDLREVDLHFFLDPDDTLVESRLRFTPKEKGPLELVLDGDPSLTLESLAIDGKPATPGKDFEHRADGSLTLLRIDRALELTIRNRFSPLKNSQLSGIYMSEGHFISQCEPHGFRRITFYPDRPDVLSVFNVRIRAPKKFPYLLSNGRLMEEKTLDKNYHEVLWHDPFRKPSYLFALVGGDFDVLKDTFTTHDKNKVNLRIFAAKGEKDYTVYAMESLKRAMKWDEDRFNLAYDLDIFNIVVTRSFNMGAMENKSLNIFNASLVYASRETATDQDYERIENVIGHEYFHNWTGDRITCRDWFQLSLKEGLTVFRDQLFAADMVHPVFKRIDQVKMLRSLQFSEDASPMAHPVRPDRYISMDNFYTRTVYEKGAEVIRMLHTILGEETFQKGMALYIRRHDGQAVRCEDFFQAMGDAYGKPLDGFFNWYHQAGTPRIKVRLAADGPSSSRLALHQYIDCPANKDPQALLIPLRVAFISPDGAPLETTYDGRTAHEHLLLFSRKEESFSFEGAPAGSILSINRHFSAPVIIEYPLEAAQIGLQLRYETDPFNRWDSAQTLSKKEFLSLADRLSENFDLSVSAEELRHKAAPAFSDTWQEALGAALKDSLGDHAFFARLCRLPGFDELLNEAPRSFSPLLLDYIPLKAAAALGTALKGDLAAYYRELHREEKGRLDPAARNRRAAKAAALMLLAAAEEDGIAAVIRSQYMGAATLSDRLAALEAAGLVEPAGRSPLRLELLADFERRFATIPEMFNKWLSLQARARGPETLETIRRLVDHPLFSLKVPNNVYSLIGGFAFGNAAGFHAPHGEGYRFVSDFVLTLDGRNPQIAARLCTAFESILQLRPPHHDLMAAQLKRILAKDDLSGNVFEIASKYLEAAENLPS